MKNRIVLFLIAAVALFVLPLIAQQFGNAWVRIMDLALLYVMLALGLNIVVGYAGLLDLGYVAFYAVGAYLFGLFAGPHLPDTFEWIKNAFPNGLHLSWWVALPVGAAVAGVAGVLLGAPTLKLRGDYLAIVTLGFGEIIRVFLNNLDAPVNVTNGPKGLAQIDSFRLFGLDLGLLDEATERKTADTDGRGLQARVPDMAVLHAVGLRRQADGRDALLDIVAHAMHPS